MKLRQAGARRLLGALQRVGEGAGLVLVFAGGSLLALLLFANLPAGKRLLARALERALSSTFYGSFSIDAVDRVSLAELRARGITVRDPAGHVVLTVSVLSTEMDLPDLARKLWLGTGAVTLRIGHTRVERAEVQLMSPQKSDVPTIADAFTPRPSATSSGPASSTRTLKVWLPQIEVGHIYTRVTIGSLPTLEGELSSVHGAVVSAPDGTAVDVERFAVLARGLGGADARGVGSVHVRTPSSVWTSFDGYFGDIQLGTVVRVDGQQLNIALDVPRAPPADVRALWQAYPIQQEVGAHVDAIGTLHSLHTQGKFLVGSAPLDAGGELRLMDNPGADLDISGRDLDLRAVFPAAPKTQVDADATLYVFKSGTDLIANVNGATRETRISDIPVPAIELNGSYSSKGFDGHATIHERGVPLKADFTVHPDGALDLTAQAKRVDLSRAPRLSGHFKGRGLLDLELKAHLEKNELDAHVDADLRDFEVGPLTVVESKISGRASGPLNNPTQLAVDFSLASKRVRAGALGFDEVAALVRGPVTSPLVSATVNNTYGSSLSAKATVITRGNPRLDHLTLEVRRDDDALTATVAQVEISGEQVRVNGLNVEGAGGKLEGSGQIGPAHLAVVARGTDLDLGVIAHALGLPRGFLAGKLGINADLDSTRKTQRGTLDLQLANGLLDGVVIDSLKVTSHLDAGQLDLQSTAQLRDFGDFTAQAKAKLDGSLGDLETLEHATGTISVKGERLPLGLLSYALPKSIGVSEVRGEADASLELSRREPTAIPSVSLLANTTGLHVTFTVQDKSGKGTAIEGVNAHVGLNVNGTGGETDLTVKLEDQHGTLVSATTNLIVDLPNAIAHPARILEQLAQTPLVAKAVVEDRPLEELPGPLSPAGISGRLRTEVSLRGTLERPIFSDKTELYQLRFGEIQRDKAIDVCAQLDYDKSTGQYGARGEVFLPSTATRACKGTRVAQFSAAGLAEWAKLTAPNSTADTAWTGTAGVSLEGLPLVVVPTFAEAGFDGRVLGAVMFDRRQALPQMFAQLEIRDAVAARTRLGTATIQVRSDGKTLSAKLGVTEHSGSLEGDVQSAVNWRGVVPSIDETRPISAHLNTRAVDAVILAPFVHDVFSEIGGKLDTELSIALTPNPDPKAEQHWTGALSGSLAMRDGTLQLARLALRMKNVTFAAHAEGHGNSTLITVDSLSAAAEAEKANIAARGNIWLDGFQLAKGNARATLRGVPLLVEGVTLATLDGENISVDVERRPTEVFVGLMIPELNAELPQSKARSLIALNNDGSIEIAQPIAEPRKAGSGESLPLRMKFDLGGKVKVTRSDLFLPLTGAPEITLGEELKVNGNIELIPGGRLNLPGLPRPFTIESGTVSFDTDSDPDNPRVSVQAICESSQVTVRAKVSGTFRKATIDLEDVDDPGVTDQATILAKLLNTPTDETTTSGASNPAAAAGIGAGAGFLGRELLANTALSNLELKAGSETTADQASYQTYSAAYPLSDTLWFEGSYKNLQGQDLSGGGANSNAFSGTFDWRFRRNWSLRTEVGNIGADVDLLWQYKY